MRKIFHVRMAGSQSLTSRDSSSPSQRNLTQSPRLWTSDSKSELHGPKCTNGNVTRYDIHGLKVTDDLTYTDNTTRDGSYKRNSSGHGRGSRKSLAVKLETRTDDEDSHSSMNENNNEGILWRMYYLSPHNFATLCNTTKLCCLVKNRVGHHHLPC